MIKKITLILLLSCMLLTICHAAFSDISLTKHERAVTEMEALQIINGYEDGSFRPGEELSRAEFCALIINTLGLEDAASGLKETEFTDVEPGHWASGYIQMAYSMRIIEGYGDGVFGPEDKVTYVQTLKMLLNSMGYAPIAEANGGYPNGYIMLGAAKISKGISAATEAPIFRGEAAQLIYNSMSVNLVEEDYGKPGEYRINYDKTLLSELMSRRGLTKKEGIVTGDRHTRISRAEGLREGQLEINGTAYYLGGISAQGLLGRYVTFYVQEDNGAVVEPTIYAIRSHTEKNTEISIAPKDIASIDLREISYYTELGGSRTAKAVLKENPATIINAGYIDGGPSDWDIKNGQIALAAMAMIFSLMPVLAHSHRYSKRNVFVGQPCA